MDKSLSLLIKTLGLSFIISASALAQEAPLIRPNYEEPRRHWLFFGADFGRAWTGEDQESSTDRSHEDRSGSHFDIKLDYSYYSDIGIFEIGVGWFKNKVSNDVIETKTQSSFLEAGYRFEFLDEFTFGPQVMMALSNDNSIAVGQEEESSEFFAGVRVDYETDAGHNKKIRVVASFLKDLTIDNRSVNIMTLGLHFGFQLGGRAKNIQYKYVTTYREGQVKVERTGERSLKATLDAKTGLFFKTSSYKVNKRAKAYLKRLAFFLNEYTTQWSHINVDGHTDPTGKFNKNILLSKRRAAAIKRELVKHGVPEYRIKPRGYGSTKLLINEKSPAAHAVNRRVELEFHGIENMKAFSSALSIVK